MSMHAIMRIKSRDHLSGFLGSVLVRLADIRDRRWRHDLERARVAFGARCSTVHVTEGEWLAHWAAGLDPVAALLAESPDD